MCQRDTGHKMCYVLDGYIRNGLRRDLGSEEVNLVGPKNLFESFELSLGGVHPITTGITILEKQ